MVSSVVGLPVESLTTVASSEIPDSLRLRLEPKVVEFGWRLGFVREPDGSLMWLFSDDETGDVLHSGTADEWDDAKLLAIENLYPPSAEGWS